MSPFSNPIQNLQLQRKRLKPYTLEDNSVFLCSLISQQVKTPVNLMNSPVNTTSSLPIKRLKEKEWIRVEACRGNKEAYKTRSHAHSKLGGGRSHCVDLHDPAWVCIFSPAQNQGGPWCNLGFIYHSENASDRLATQLAMCAVMAEIRHRGADCPKAA